MPADHVVDIELTLAVTARAGLAAALAAVADRFGAGEGEPGDAADDETASPVAAGLSAAFDQLTRVPEAVRTACTVVEVARRRAPVEADGETGAVATVIAAEELTPAEWLLAANRMRAGREALTGFVAPLGEHPELLETLIVYLRSRMDDCLQYGQQVTRPRKHGAISTSAHRGAARGVTLGPVGPDQPVPGAVPGGLRGNKRCVTTTATLPAPGGSPRRRQAVGVRTGQRRSPTTRKRPAPQRSSRGGRPPP